MRELALSLPEKLFIPPQRIIRIKEYIPEMSRNHISAVNMQASVDIRIYTDNHNIIERAVAGIRRDRGNLVYHVKPLDSLTEHGILSIKLMAGRLILDNLEL